VREAAARAGRALVFTRALCSPRSTIKIVRYALPAGAIVPQGARGDDRVRIAADRRPSHASVRDRRRRFHVCRPSPPRPMPVRCKTARRKSPGIDPCRELETRGGIWRYDANKTNQKILAGRALRDRHTQCRGALRSIRRETVYSSPSMGATSCIRIGRAYTRPTREATQPAEELLLLTRGRRLRLARMLLRRGAEENWFLAPEYGGDGGNKLGPWRDQGRSDRGVSGALGAEWDGAV